MKIMVMLSAIKRFIYPFKETRLLSYKLDKVRKELYYSLGAIDFAAQKMDFEKRYDEIDGKKDLTSKY